MKNSQILEIMKLLIDGCKWFRWAENAQFQHTANTRRHSGRGERWDPGHSCEGGLSKRWLACSARCTPFPAKTGPLRVSREGLDFVNNESLHTFFLFLVDGRERDVHADVRERPCESVLSFHHVVSGDPTRVGGLGTKHLWLLSHLTAYQWDFRSQRLRESRLRWG